VGASSLLVTELGLILTSAAPGVFAAAGITDEGAAIPSLVSTGGLGFATSHGDGTGLGW
jgi:hypothetical protein